MARAGIGDYQVSRPTTAITFVTCNRRVNGSSLVEIGGNMKRHGLNDVRRAAAGLAVICAAVSGWAACSGDETNSATGTGTTTATATSATGTSAGGSGSTGTATGGGGAGTTGTGGNATTTATTGAGGADVCGGCAQDEICDPQLGCVECVGDGDCTAPTPICVEQLGSCEECALDTDCPDMEKCHPAQHTCNPACLDNNDCGMGQADICDLPNGVCVECLTADDCGGELCDAFGTCVECLTAADCPDGEICSIEGHCEQCVVNGDCPMGNVCIDQECIAACATNDDCGGDTPLCEPVSSQCVECVANTDCADGETCIDFECNG
jgi:hypothetical protein